MSARASCRAVWYRCLPLIKSMPAGPRCRQRICSIRGEQIRQEAKMEVVSTVWGPCARSLGSHGLLHTCPCPQLGWGMPALLPSISLSCDGERSVHPSRDCSHQGASQLRAKGKSLPIIQMWQQLHSWPLAEGGPPLVRVWMWAPPLTGTGIKVHENTARSCAAIPPRNTQVCARASGAALSTAHTELHSPVPELTAVPSLQLSSGLPCSRAHHIPHRSDPPNSPSRQRLPGCCRHWGVLALLWCLWLSAHNFKGN